MIFDQAGYDARCEWGLRGVRSLAPGSDAVVIVDVLSFSTAVDIAVARGAEVIPCRLERCRGSANAQVAHGIFAVARVAGVDSAGRGTGPAVAERQHAESGGGGACSDLLRVSAQCARGGSASEDRGAARCRNPCRRALGRRFAAPRAWKIWWARAR